MGTFVQLTAADGVQFPAYVAQPAVQSKGGLVVLQEIFGVNSHIQAVADGYAAEGYFVVAPSTFHRVKAGVELGYSPDDMSAGMALKATVEALPAPGVLQDITWNGWGVFDTRRLVANAETNPKFQRIAVQGTLASAGEGISQATLDELAGAKGALSCVFKMLSCLIV